MKVTEISQVLKEEAVNLGLCVAWTNEWGSPTKEQMVDMYIKGLDFCILNNYPSPEFIKENFGEAAETKGVFTDAKVKVLNPPIAVLNGKCSGVIELTGFASVDIHVRHNSNIKIIVRDNAKAFVRVYDDAHAEIENVSHSRSFLYRKGGKATLNGDVAVRNYKRVSDDWELITR